MSTEIARRLNAYDLIAAFQRAVAAIRFHFAAIVDIENEINSACGLDSHQRIHVSACGHTFWDNFDDAEQAIRIVNREMWELIVERLELKRMMSTTRYAALTASLAADQEKKLPLISEESVRAFVAEHATDARSNFEEAIAEVFSWLRPNHDTPRAQYKTNQKNATFEIGRTVVLTGMCEIGPRRGMRVVRTSTIVSQRMIALENVFSGLDGRGTAIKAHASPIELALNASPDGRAETPYFRVKCFKNGNMHLEFLRDDLRAELNRRAGGACGPVLKGARS